MQNLLWSVMIPTYNASRYLAETLETVLAQNIPATEMEIVVVDNCSDDNTVSIARAIGGNRVQVIVNEENMGMTANFNRCIEVAKGELLHLLNADDLVKAGFYQTYQSAFAQYPEVYLVSSTTEIINEKSAYQHTMPTIPSLHQPSNDVSGLVRWNPFRTPAIVVRKEAYHVVGGFDTSLTHAVDWDMWIRVIHRFKGLHLDTPLCQYREHPFNETSKVFRTGEDILDLERVYYKFLKAGYPVDEKQFREDLAGISWWQYVKYSELDMREAAEALKAICLRYWPAGKFWRKEMGRKISKAFSSSKNEKLEKSGAAN